MALDRTFVDFVCDQAGSDFGLTYRAMFGGFAFYLDGKVVGLADEGQFFLKPTDPGREILGTANEQPPYPGARPCFLLGDELEDPDLLRRLLTATARALPAPKPKRPRQKS